MSGSRPATEFWTMAGFRRPEEIAPFARRIEADGWDGLTLHDSQNLWGDPFVYMTAAALATQRLKFNIGTSNPVTRHPAASAAAIASVAALAPGRIGMGIGRGDSAMAYIGGSPASLAHFRSYLQTLRQYLHRQEVDFDAIAGWLDQGRGPSAAVDRLPGGSRLQWLTEADEVVPIEVMATGPKMIQIAARHADTVFLGLGANVERLTWGIALAREAFAGRTDIPRLRIAASAYVAVCDDRAQARAMLADNVSSSARWSAMHGKFVGPGDAAMAATVEKIARDYQMTRHGHAGRQKEPIGDDFIDAFAIAGPVDYCVERIRRLIALGLDKLTLAPPQGDHGEAGRQAYADLIGKVLPQLRAP